MRYILAIFALLLMSGCHASQDGQISALHSSKQKWLSYAGQRDYRFTYRRQCFCAYTGKDIVILVKHNKVASARIVGQAISTQSLPTMLQLFALIQDAIAKQHQGKGLSIQVKYQTSYGYPEKIIIKRHVMDGSATIEVKDVRLL